MRIHPSVLVAVLLSVVVGCGSADAPDKTTADATTGAESNGGDTAGTGGSSPEAGVAGASAAGASAGSSGAGAGAGSSGSNSGAGGDSSNAKCDPSCPDGQRCDLVQVTCIRAPCPPLPMCIAATSCDPAQILCKRVAPMCPQGQVPSVSGSCYGPCVPVESCACSKESECPNHDSYTCHLSAGRCGPYV